MPKTIYIPEDARHSGIDITWTPSAGRLDIGGWYDTMVGIQTGSMTLAEFFAKLGITEKDVRKALAANMRTGNAQNVIDGAGHYQLASSEGGRRYISAEADKGR